jgi:hypothetical protein
VHVLVPLISAAISVKLRQRLCEDRMDGRLPTSCRAHQHVPVPHNHRLKQLDDLQLEVINLLQVRQG